MALIDALTFFFKECAKVLRGKRFVYARRSVFDIRCGRLSVRE